MGAFIVIAPHIAGASWPFSSAAAADDAQPFLHDGSMRLLSVHDASPDASSTDPFFVLDGSALVPNPAPDLVTPNAGPIAAGGAISRYTVKNGDTLSAIAQKYGITVNTLLWANDITNARSVKPGMDLIILPVSGIRHAVASGDSLGSIAKKYGADQGDIASFNRIATDTALVAGTEIIIPGGELSVTAPTQTGTKKTTAVDTSKNSSSKTPSSKTIIRTGGSLTMLTAAGGSAEPNGFFTNPVPGALVTQSIHGWNAVDLAAPNGTPIYAAAAGTVIISKVGGYNGGYGNYVVIDHGSGVQTLYAHLATDSVSVGDAVAQGARIGTVGISGVATGYHLHLEVRGAKNPYAGCAVMTRCGPQ